MKRTRVTRLVSIGAERPTQATPHPIEDPPLLPLYEAARRLGISVKSLQARIADGTIVAIPIGESGKYMKVPVAEIEKWRLGHYAAFTGHRLDHHEDR